MSYQTRTLSNRSRLPVVIGLIAVVTLACNGLVKSPTPDTQATVDAAVAATKTAELNLQATVDAAVAATQTTSAVVQATADSIVQPTTEAVVTPVPAEDYAALSEEELSTLIDEAVSEAVAANEAYSQAASNSSSDYYLTEEEIQELEALIYTAEESISQADDLIYLYYDMYAELAYDTLYLLQDVEDDLDEMMEYAETIVTILEENSDTIEQGLELATETITQIQETAQAAINVASETHGRTETWTQELNTVRDRRIDEALTVTPDQVPPDKLAAVFSGFQYSDAIFSSFQDGKISPDELKNIAQLGANAQAGLQTHGGPVLAELGDSISGITENVARGDWTRAKGEARSFETKLGERPSQLPDRPEIEKPQIELPDRPQIDKPDLPKPRK